MIVLGCSDDVSVTAKHRCCPLTFMQKGGGLIRKRSSKTPPAKVKSTITDLGTGFFCEIDKETGNYVYAEMEKRADGADVSIRVFLK